MTHTYLFWPGVWTAEGTYWDDQARPIKAVGRSEVLHERKGWRLKGSLTALTASPVTFVNEYLIEPFPPGADYTPWTSKNPALGTLQGWFVLIENAMLSHFVSENGTYAGLERLGMVSPNEYVVEGSLFHVEKKLSSWKMTLRRE